MFIPITRIITVLMFGAICFVLIVPLALQHGNVLLAGGITILYIAYLIANVFLWRRMKSRR
jgi:hypothetical protein